MLNYNSNLLFYAWSNLKINNSTTKKKEKKPYLKTHKRWLKKYNAEKQEKGGGEGEIKKSMLFKVIKKFTIFHFKLTKKRPKAYYVPIF